MINGKSSAATKKLVTKDDKIHSDTFAAALNRAEFAKKWRERCVSESSEVTTKKLSQEELDALNTKYPPPQRR